MIKLFCERGDFMENDWEFFVDAKQVTISSLILANYQKLGLTEEELVLFLQIDSQLQAGKNIPDIEKISQAMGKASTDIYSLMHKLVEKKVLAINTVSDENGRETNQYSFKGLYQKLVALKRQEEMTTSQAALSVSRAEIYKSIEVEFGRALTPMELQTIDMWFSQDHYQPELVKLALREAVLNQVYNLRYIDRILISWEKQNIKTAADAQKLLVKQREVKAAKWSKTTSQSKVKDKPEIPVYKWSNRTEGEH